MNLKDHFINTVADELNHLNGSDFESLCRPVIEILTDREFELKGHNLEMKPVRGSVDLIQDDDCGIIGQCGTDKDYFTGNKAISDIDGSLKNSPNFHTIYLFCNRRATGTEFQTLDKIVSTKLNSIKRRNFSYQYHIYDSQRIAKVIYENVYKTIKITEILSYLPKSYEYYLSLPQTNTLPLQKTGYRHRFEEAEIGEKLIVNDFLQIYGLSGMGKTQTAIAVANNLIERFDTILWLDEQSFASGSFENVGFQRMGKSINLAHMLKMFRVLVIVDNYNTNVGKLMEEFSYYSQRGSKCLVTSLQCNVAYDNAYKLRPMAYEESKAILNDCKVRPTEEQVDLVLKNVGGFPLLLDLSKRSVENGDLTWEEIVGISNMTEINDDEKNELFAKRIVGHYKDQFKDIFNLLIGLDNTFLSKLFLREKKKLEYNALLRSAIIEDTDEFGCRIHSIVLTAIKTVVEKQYSENDFLKYLKVYLGNHVISRDAGLYTFTGIHKTLILKLLENKEIENSLRKIIILSYLYSVDTYLDPHPFIQLITSIDLCPHSSDIDLRLLIERLELEFRKYTKETNDTEFLKNWILDRVKYFDELNLNSPEKKALIDHHIGKWMSGIQKYEDSEKYLLRAIEQSPNHFNSLLRLARDYHKREMLEKATETLDAILDSNVISQVPISIRLAAYDMISGYKYKSLRTCYIDERQEQFAEDMYASLSESYTQTYIVLAKLANHLSYNYPEFFSRLCSRLPLPLDIENNERVRKDYGKIKSAQYIFGQYTDEYKDRLFRIAEGYLLSVKRVDDYVRKDLIRLYLAANLPEKCKEIADELVDREDIFNLQLLCKVYYANDDYYKALGCIENAINKENPLEKEYCAAFRHDKALCHYSLKEQCAVDVMKEAIELQPNDKVKKQWQDELYTWDSSAGLMISDS